VCNLLTEWMVEQLDIGFVLDMLDIEFLGRTCSTCSTCSTLSFMAATSCFDPACQSKRRVRMAGSKRVRMALHQVCSPCLHAGLLMCCSRGNLVAAVATLLQPLQTCCSSCKLVATVVVSAYSLLSHTVYLCVCVYACVCVRVCVWEGVCVFVCVLDLVSMCCTMYMCIHGQSQSGSVRRESGREEGTTFAGAGCSALQHSEGG